MGIEIVSNGSRKISFFPLFVKEKTVFLFFYFVYNIDFPAWQEKLHHIKR